MRLFRERRGLLPDQFGLGDLSVLSPCLPLQNLQIKNEDCIENRYQKLRDERCYTETNYLGVRERLPERSTVQRERKSARTVVPTVIMTDASG